MSIPFLNNIDLLKNEIQNAAFQNLGSAPSVPSRGQFYFDTLTNRLANHTGSVWIEYGQVDSVTLTQPASGLTITNSGVAQTGNSLAFTFALAGELAGLQALAATGIVARTNTGTYAARTITGTANQISVSNGNGVGGDPTLSLPQDIATASSPTFANISISNAPTLAAHAVRKDYVDALVQGFSWKTACRAATTVAGGNIALTGTQTIDGVVLVVGDRVLVKNQTTVGQNGIYVVASGAWSRSTDCDTQAEMASASTVIQEGSINKDTIWLATVDASGTLGTTDPAFVQLPSQLSVLAGNGLVQNGNIIDINVDNATLEVNTDILRVKDLGITTAKLANAAVDLTTKVTGALPIGNGGTGQITQAAGFDALSPTTTNGDISYRGASNNVRLAGNTTATKMFLSMTSSVPSWGTLSFSDISGGTVGVAVGGTGANLSATGGVNQVVMQTTVGGAFTVAQLSFSNISGSVGSTQMPALTGDATTTAGTTAVTVVSSTLSDAGTITAPTVFTIAHTSSATPSSGFGSTLLWTLKDSSTLGVSAASEVVSWVVATHTTQTARRVFNIFDTAAREAMRMEASGTAPMIGFLGANAVARQTGDIGTALVTLGLMSGTPTVNLANISGTLGIGAGGTGQTTAILAFNALSPLTTSGDMIYRDATNNVRLAGNATATKQFLSMTSSVPTWGILQAADIPSLAASIITSGTLAVAVGGTGANLSATGGASQVLKQTSVGGAITVAQLAFTDISGSVAAGQMPALTGDATTTAGSTAVSVVSATLNDATTATAPTVFVINHNTSGTPAAGYGSTTKWQLETTTTISTDAADETVTWVVATHASRTARKVFNIYDTAVREAMRIEASGTAAMIGFLGATASARLASPDVGTALVTFGLASGTPTFAPANLSAAVPINKGGTGQITNTAGFDALAPTTTAGDFIYRNGTNNIRLAGNATATKQFLSMTSSVPSWVTLSAADVSGATTKYVQSIGDNTTTSFTITHNLNTTDITVSFHYVTGGQALYIDYNKATVNTITFTLPVAPLSTNQIRVVVIG